MKILVTGAGSGIGLGIVQYFSTQNVFVYAGCLNEEEVACVESISNVKAFVANVTQPPFDICAELEASNTRLWSIICCAGVSTSFGPVEFLDTSAVATNFQVNCIGTIHTVQAFLPFLNKAGGRILLMSSYNGFAPFPFYSGYNMSKFAVEGLAETLRLELRMAYPQTHVVVVQPGSIYPTAMNSVNSGKRFNAQMKAYADKMGAYGPIDAEACMSSSHASLSSATPLVFAKKIYDIVVCASPSHVASIPQGVFWMRLLKHLLPDRLWFYLHLRVVKWLWAKGL